MGGTTANIRGLYKRDGIRGMGEVERTVVDTDSYGTAAEDQAKRDFGSSVGAAVTGIWKVW